MNEMAQEKLEAKRGKTVTVRVSERMGRLISAIAEHHDEGSADVLDRCPALLPWLVVEHGKVVAAKVKLQKELEEQAKRPRS